MSLGLWGAALLGALLGAAPVSRWSRLDEARRNAALAAGADRSVAERFLSMSEGFLGTPYLASPLGEGEGIDPDPPLRFDAVDCLTFVEQALAMSLAHSEGELLPLLDQLRYSGKRAYVERNHLMEADWLPGNLRKGFLKELTREVGGADVLRVTKLLSKRTWASKTSAALRLPKERQPVGELPLEIVPWEKVLASAKRAPSGALMLVVREERELLPTRISHLGILVKVGAALKFRHASRTLGRVVDEPLESFLARHARYGRWRVAGASFFEVTRPSSVLAKP